MLRAVAGQRLWFAGMLFNWLRLACPRTDWTTFYLAYAAGYIWKSLAYAAVYFEFVESCGSWNGGDAGLSHLQACGGVGELG